MDSATIKQGDSLPWLARPNTLASGELIDANWICRAGVYDKSHTEVIAPFTVTDKYTLDGEEYFVVALTRQQTVGLAAGTYILAIDVRNDTVSPSYSDESYVTVIVETQCLPV